MNLIRRSGIVNMAGFILVVSGVGIGLGVSATTSSARRATHEVSGQLGSSTLARNPDSRFGVMAATNLPMFSGSLISAVDATGETIAPVGEGVVASVGVPEDSAVSEAVLDSPGTGNVAVAAQVVELSDTLYPNGQLVWAIDIVPSSGFPTTATPVGYTGALPPPDDFMVNFIDASTGKWLEAVSGYSAALTRD